MNDDAEIERQARNAKLCQEVVSLWRAGLDTTQIAICLTIGEPVVCRILNAWRDLRRMLARATA